MAKKQKKAKGLAEGGAQPRVLFWDIETAPIVATTWTLYKPNLSHDNILEGTSMLTAAYRWLGEEETHYLAINPKHPRDDKQLVTGLRPVLASASVLVAHNGDKFDLKHYNARALVHGLAPLPKIPTIDTLKVARKYFRLDSNRLDYLGKLLLGRGKIHTDYDLWLRIVMEHDKKALHEMIDYNCADVELLEQVYLKLRPFIHNHPRVGEAVNCPNCGSAHTQRRGVQVNRKTASQRLQCQGCGAWFVGERIK